MSVTALASWYGSNRILAKHVGDELAGCAWVGVPFAGGMCELQYIGARTLQVNDKHIHIINLARVARDPELGPKLYRRLRRRAFHPVELEAAQDCCRVLERSNEVDRSLFDATDVKLVDNLHKDVRLEWAEAYFICAWMSRHSTAGTKNEFNAPLSTRWNAGGGDSAAHFHGAVRELPAWRRVLRRANFTTDDAFDFIDRVFQTETKERDKPPAKRTRLGIYVDPPFPGPGDLYKHTFGVEGQRRLSTSLSRFQDTRVVCRFYEHPLVAELYPEGRWTYVRRVGRKQTNGSAAELLIINGARLGKDIE